MKKHVEDKWLYVGLVLIALPIVLWGGSYIWILSSADILEHPLASLPMWPAVCSTSGCITTATWVKQHDVQVMFAQATESEDPSTADSLTTTVRQYLVRKAYLRLPVTVEDARRYRERVLQLENEALIMDSTGLTASEYDSMVILPLLQQEAFRQEHSFLELDEVFDFLAKERTIVIPLWRYAWNAETASIVTE